MIDKRTALELVAFDLDDTLYPEISFVHSGFRAVARDIEEKFSCSHNFYDLLRDIFLEGERNKTFNKALARAGLPVTDNVVAEMWISIVLICLT